MLIILICFQALKRSERTKRVAFCVGKRRICDQTGDIFKPKHALWKFVEQSGSHGCGFVVSSYLMADMGLLYYRELTECLWFRGFLICDRVVYYLLVNF